VTIESKRVLRMWEQIQHCTVCFLLRRCHRCWCQHGTVQTSIRVQPEIKMADVKPEILVHQVAERICVKFRQCPYLWENYNMVELMGVLSDFRKSEKSKYFLNTNRFRLRQWKQTIRLQLDELGTAFTAYYTWTSFDYTAFTAAHHDLSLTCFLHVH